jgi:hypothetical protein
MITASRRKKAVRTMNATECQSGGRKEAASGFDELLVTESKVFSS